MKESEEEVSVNFRMAVSLSNLSKIYNELPRDIRASDNFKQQVKQHFK